MRTHSNLEKSGEHGEITARHADYFLEIAEQITRVRSAGGDVDWLALERDHDNLRAALRTLIERNDGEAVVRFVEGLGFLWAERGHLSEGSIWFEEAVRLAVDLPRPWQAQVSVMAARFAWQRRDFDRATRDATFALAAYREAGDAGMEAVSLRLLGVIAASRGDLETADDLLDQAAVLFETLGHDPGLHMVAHDRAVTALKTGDYGRARVHLEESLARARALGSDQRLSHSLCDLGMLALLEHRREQADALLVECLEHASAHGLRQVIAHTLWGLATARRMSHDLASAALLAGAADALCQEIDEELEDYEQTACADALALASQPDPQPEIAAALAAGKAMSDSEAAAYALATVAAQPAPAVS